MTTDCLEPREETYEELIEHLEKLECSLPDEPIPKKMDSIFAVHLLGDWLIRQRAFQLLQVLNQFFVGLFPLVLGQL